MTDDDEDTPDMNRLAHKPMFLLPYRAYDGPYAGASDCRYLSLGWAQWDLHSASLKALRHAGKRWSRQSEELPLHRAIDAVTLLALAMISMEEGELRPVHAPPDFFENQREFVTLDVGRDWPEAFAGQITSQRVRDRLSRLRDVLNGLHDQGKL